MDNSLPKIAAFDFDGTLTNKDTLIPFLEYVCGPYKTWLEAAKLLPSLCLYPFGLVTRQQIKEKFLKNCLGGMELLELQEKGASFVTGPLQELLNKEAIEKLRWHQQQEHITVLVSANLDVFLESFGASMGFDAVICSRMDSDSDGKVNGLLLGKNCWGIEKVLHLEKFLGPRQGYILYAYGDSKGDRELLDYANYSFYKNI